MNQDYSDIWHSLEVEAGASGFISGILRRRISSHSSHNIFLALSSPHNQRMLIIQTNRSLYVSDDKLPHSKAIKVVFINIPEDPPDSISLAVILTDSQFSDVFDALVQDVVLTIESISTESQMVTTCTERLRRWQEFMKAYGVDGLDPMAIRGLMGELHVLLNYLLTCSPTFMAVDSWVGPNAQPQDFRLSSLGIEVKVTVGKKHDLIHINNELQLDDTGLNALCLAHIRMVEASTGGHTLPGIVENVRSHLIDDISAVKLFEDRLMKSGYLDTHVSRYQEQRYRILSCDAYRVAEGFPRITAETLPDGVGDVRYTIVASSLGSFSLSDKEFKGLIDGASGG